MFDARSLGHVSGSVTVRLCDMFRLIPVAFKLQVYQLCLCWNTFQNTCATDNIVGVAVFLVAKEKTCYLQVTIFIAVPVTAAWSSGCTNPPTFASPMWATGVSKRGDTELCLIWMRHEYCQNLTEEICR